MAKRPKKRKAVVRKASAKAPAKSGTAQGFSFWIQRDWFWGLILLVVIVLVYQPVWYAGFIWDDDELVTANPCIVGPLGLKEIWTTGAADICPLTLTVFWVEHALWGLAPPLYHLVNVLLHGACAVLLWRVLRSLVVPGAWMGAALWALHPVEVESVAWIAEMKNTLSGLFFLLSILFFVKGLKSQSGWNDPLTWLFAALAMASKSSTVILPVVLSLCAWWVEGRWRWSNLVKVGPILLLSVIVGVISIWTQKLQGYTGEMDKTRSWPERLITAGDAVWFYLGKLLWPHPLIAIYLRGPIDASQWFSYLPLLAVVIVLIVLWLKRESWSRSLFLTFAYFLVALLPVLGLANMSFFRYAYVADHFQYLASMGPLALVGAGLVRFSDAVLPGKPWSKVALGAGLLLILALLSWRQVWVYENQETLWTDTLAKNPNSWVAHNGLGNGLDQKGQVNEAMEQFQKALELNSNDAQIHNNLGGTFFQKKRMDEAIKEFQKALELDPNNTGARNNLGLAFLHSRRMDEAREQFQKAGEINPINAEAYYNLGLVLLQKGQADAAIVQFQKALEINPNYAEAHNNLGVALFQKGQADEVIVQFQKALEINSNYAEAHTNLGLVFLQSGRVDEAIEQFRKTSEINPNDAQAHNNLGKSLVQKGRLDEAIDEFQKALAINPNYASAQNNLAQARRAALK